MRSYPVLFLNEDGTELNIYFNHEKGASLTDYVFSVKKNGKAWDELELLEIGSSCVVVVKGIAAKDLCAAYTVEATRDGETYSVTMTPLSYTRLAQNDAAEGTVVRGLYQFAMAAKDFR